MTDGTFQRRESERFPTHLKGRISFDDDTAPIDCVMSEISTTGARIGCAEGAEIPLEFELQIPEEGACARVRLVWSNGRVHGVAFVD
jgi:hypothetical protein